MQKGFTPILILVGIFALIALGGGYLLATRQNIIPPKNNPKACAQDAKQCPDGSYVSRTGPNCEFKECPTPKSTSSPDQTANWEIYTDQNRIFTIKLPTFVVTKSGNSADTNGGGIATYVGFWPNFLSDNGELLIKDKSNEAFRLLIYFSDNKDHLTNEDIKRDLLKKPVSSAPGDVAAWEQIKNSLRLYKNGDIEGYYYEKDYEEGIVGTHNNKYFFISYEGLYNTKVSQQSEQLISKILSTFKFLDQNSTSP